MANFALHNTTLEELQAFIQDMPTSTTFTVIFDKMPAKKQLVEFVNSKKECTDINNGSKQVTQREMTDFTKLEAFGIWSDREGMADSVTYVNKLRSKQWEH